MSIVSRLFLGSLGFIVLVDAILRKGPYRLGVHDFDDDSDIVLDRRTGRTFEIVLGIVLILGAVLIRSSE